MSKSVLNKKLPHLSWNRVGCVWCVYYDEHNPQSWDESGTPAEELDGTEWPEVTGPNPEQWFAGKEDAYAEKLAASKKEALEAWKAAQSPRAKPQCAG